MKTNIKLSIKEALKSKKNQAVMGSMVQKYKSLYVAILAVISAFEVFFIVRGCLKFDFNKLKCVEYMGSYIFLLLASLTSLIYIIFKHSNKTYSIVVHAYGTALVMWSTFISILDLKGGSTPIVFLTIIVMLAGLVVIHPIFFIVIVTISMGIIFILSKAYGFEYFSSSGEVLNVIVFYVMSIILEIRHYSVSMSEAETKDNLERITRTCPITGLGNELAYYETVESIEHMIKKRPIKYAVVVMDVNLVKHTDDTYGHQYGNHLIVTAGKALPTIFTNSRCFHIGGDEFVIIVTGDDLIEIENRIKRIDTTLSYSQTSYEGQILTLSVARGYALSGEGLTYNEVFLFADKAMYKNKKEIKAKYDMPNR